MTTARELWVFIEKIIKEAQEHKLSNGEILAFIALLKCGQTSLMLNMDSHKYPFEDKEVEKQ